MIEVLVAVLIAGLVSTAALKLTAQAQQALRQVREREILLDEAVVLQTTVALDPTLESGTSGDFTWETEHKEKPFMENLGQLDLNVGENRSSLDVIKSKDEKIEWDELTVERKGQSITLVLPQAPQEGSVASGDEVSKDTRSTRGSGNSK